IGVRAAKDHRAVLGGRGMGSVLDGRDDRGLKLSAGRRVGNGLWPASRTRSTVTVMRFTYAEAMTDATYYAPLAQAAEAAGYTSMTVADSLIYPLQSDTQYPYTDTGDR